MTNPHHVPLYLPTGGVFKFLPAQELYLHKVLCYMYRGPPPQGHAGQVNHLCENRMCLAPWHMRWGDQQANLVGYHVHKKHRTQYLV
jgi:hypothetical protein